MHSLKCPFLFLYRQKSSAVEAIYLWYSLIFLISRVLYLSLSAAEVNDESKRVVPVIRNLPSAVWCVDAERFLDHLTTDTIALTGMNFFTLTRSLILKVSVLSLCVCAIVYRFAASPMSHAIAFLRVLDQCIPTG